MILLNTRNHLEETEMSLRYEAILGYYRYTPLYVTLVAQGRKHVTYCSILYSCFQMGIVDFQKDDFCFTRSKAD